MDNKSWGIIAVLGGIAAWLYYQQQQTPGTASDSAVSFTDDPLASVSDVVVASTAGWKSVGEGPTWIDSLNAVEQQYGIPTDLLARVAYQESHFRPDIITGAKTSSVGALGMMQLMPQDYASVRVARPFTPADTIAQMDEAAQALVSHYNRFKSWPMALAAYNDGEGNTHAVITGVIDPKTGKPRVFPKQTTDYLAQVLADVPAANA